MLNYDLIYGDCIEKMQDLAKEEVKVNLILTDLPYGTTACKWDNIIPFDEMWECIKNISYDSTPILLFGSEPFSSRLRLSNIDMFKYDWIWYKNRSSGFPFAKKQPLRNHEIISVFYKSQPTYNPIKEPRDMSESSRKRLKYKYKGNYGSEVFGFEKSNEIKMIDDLSYPKTIKKFNTVPNNCSWRFHPSQKPIELLEYLIKTYSNEGNIVLDFTMGSGSTGIACYNLKRGFIGIEKDKKYFKIAEERLKKAKEAIDLDKWGI